MDDGCAIALAAIVGGILLLGVVAMVVGAGLMLFLMVLAAGMTCGSVLGAGVGVFQSVAGYFKAFRQRCD